MPEEKQKSDSFNPGDSIGLIALVFAVIAFTVSPPAWLKLLLLVIAVIGVFVAVHFSHWSHSWSRVGRVSTSLAITLVLIWIGGVQINAQLKTEDGITLWEAVSKGAHAVVGYLSRPWPQRFVCGVVGVLLTLLGQVVFSWVVSRKSAGERLAESDKGFLDYRLQAENAVNSLGPALEPIAKIMGEVGTVLESMVRPDPKVSSQTTETQIRGLKQKAQKIDSLSNAMDAKCVGLEEVARLFSEGMPGWVGLMYRQPGAKEDLVYTVSNLTRLVSTIEKTQAHWSGYIGAVESARGVSRDMNLALDNHVRSVRRVGDASEKILEACKKTLQIANGG
jgi:hypothetical protein